MIIRKHAEPIIVTRDASFVPASYDEAENTIEVVWTTGARVFRQPWFDEPFIEELSTDPAHVRLERLNSGAPFLRAHNSWSLDNVLGSVLPDSARMEDGQGVARIRLSDEDGDREIVNKIRKGLIRNTSVGYSIHRTEVTEATESSPKIVRATDWEPHEISAVPIGADPGAVIRAGFVRLAGGDAPPPTEEPQARLAEAGESAQTETTTPADADETRSNADAGAPAQTNGDAMSTDTQLDPEAIRQAEKTRAAGIRATVRSLKLEESVADEMIDKDITLDEARAKLIEMRAAKDDANAINSQTTFEAGNTDNFKERHAAMGRALLHRINGKAYKLDDAAREYRACTLLEMAKESLRMHGHNIRGWGKSQIADQALHMKSQRHAPGAFHTTDDFPIVLADVINKELRRSYDETPRTFEPFVRRTTANDFRGQHRIQFGEAPRLLQINEHGEFTRGTVGESEEVLTLQPFGRIVGVTRQVIVNDDTGAFGRLATLFGAAAASLEADLVYAVLTDNALMNDGFALFDAANHNNIVAAGGAPSTPQIGAMRNLMRQQVGVDPTVHIDVQLRHLIVPTALETQLEQTLSDLLVPNVDGEVTPRSIRALNPIAEPRLDDTSTVVWYGAADPGQFDVIELMFLAGEEGLVTQTLNGWDIDGMEVKARMDVDAAPIDHRGLVQNPGA